VLMFSAMRHSNTVDEGAGGIFRPSKSVESQDSCGAIGKCCCIPSKPMVTLVS
jgi:hypothetical protein